MTPIPDDIMRRADELVAAIDAASSRYQRIRRAARAIMDERERCAAIVLKIHPHTNINTDLHKAREEIEAAILKGEE